MTTTPEDRPVNGLEKVAELTRIQGLPAGRSWKSLTGLWHRKTTVIATLSIVSILLYLVLRFGFHAPSGTNRLPLLATLALIAAIFALIAYFTRNDFRWMVGALVIMATWPYWFVVMAPVTARLLAMTPGLETRQLVRVWGWLEAGLCVLGAASVVIFLWALS